MKWNKKCFADDESVKGVHAFRGHKVYMCMTCGATYSYHENTDKKGNTLYTVTMNPNGFVDEEE